MWALAPSVLTANFRKNLRFSELLSQMSGEWGVTSR